MTDYYNSKYTVERGNQYKDLMILFSMQIEENYETEYQKEYMMFLKDSSKKNRVYKNMK